MKVIVAGLPKTGTKSMSAALRQLGYEVYDFLENCYFLETEWYDIFEKGWTTEKFYQMYKDVDAVADMPACYFWEEISRAFPDAKIILTVRDDEEEWMKSFKHHFGTMDSHPVIRMHQLMEVVLRRKTGLIRTVAYKAMLNVNRTVFGRRTHLNESLLKLKYRAYKAYTIKSAPADKLLVFNCKEGWEPLCKFLELPVPDTPFPHKNIKASVIDHRVNGHPVGDMYKRELTASALMLLTKVILVCVAIAFLGISFA